MEKKRAYRVFYHNGETYVLYLTSKKADQYRNFSTVRRIERARNIDP